MPYTATDTVSIPAIIRRINRKLKTRGELLKVARGRSVLAEVGRYYVVDMYHNMLMLKWVDLEEYGRELGVLSVCEQVEEQ